MSPAPVARATSLSTAIQAKVPMMALLGGPKQADRVENVIRELATAQIGVVRISNPLVSPLSLERLVLQITRDEVDEVSRDETERVLRALIARSDMRRQVVVVVEQAETLTAEALEFLHGLSGLSHPSLAPVQVALVGSPTLGARIEPYGACIVGDPADLAASTAVQTPTLAMEPVRSRIGTWLGPKVLLAGLGLGGVAAALFLINGSAQPKFSSSPPLASRLTPETNQPRSSATAGGTQLTAAATSPPVPAAPLIQPMDQQPSTETLPTPAQSPPPAELPVAVPPPTPSAPSPEDAATARAALYRKFTAFLGSRSLGKRLSPLEREALFQEYLSRHQGVPSSSQTASSTQTDTSRIPGDPRVLLFFVSGSEPDLSAAQQQADLLWDRVAGLELRPVPDVLSVPTIRYEFPSDRAAALALAQTTRAQGGEWLIEDTTASPKRSGPGTIEMWLPRR
ncbi:MAG: hypothetical protein M3N26_03555 [Pseudomonadota bacterium]|nr:hypothetical protein [Pseudomonadota bacterium]